MPSAITAITHGSRRLRLEVSVPDTDPHIPSIVDTYPGADWHERETWDMFGVVFDDRPDLTRILMPDDWAGHHANASSLPQSMGDCNNPASRNIKCG